MRLFARIFVCGRRRRLLRRIVDDEGTRRVIVNEGRVTITERPRPNSKRRVLFPLQVTEKWPKNVVTPGTHAEEPEAEALS
jgi:hypothetical protein